MNNKRKSEESKEAKESKEEYVKKQINVSTLISELRAWWRS